MRPIRLAYIAVLATVLAGCTSVVSGRGGPASLTGSASTSPTRVSPPDKLAAYYLGDPRTADLCRLVDLPAYRDIGTTVPDDAQTAAMCYVTVTSRTKQQVGLSVIAMPSSQAKPRAMGKPTTMAELPVVRFPGDEVSCRRDVWTDGPVLSASVQNLSVRAMATGILCDLSDRLAKQVATGVTAGAVPRRPLAHPSLVTRDLCRGVTARDLATAPGGAPLTVSRRYFPSFCHASNSRYTLGVQVAFRRAGVKPLETTAAGGYVLSSFEPVSPSSVACEVTSIQGRTANPAVVEAVQLYVLASNGGLRGQKLCDLLTGAAGKILKRLQLH